MKRAKTAALAVTEAKDRIRSEPIIPKKAKGGRAPKKSLAERHAAMVDTSAGPNACHPWTGSVAQQTGYGQISGINPKTGKRTMRQAHVVAWELENGRKVPKTKHVLHAQGCSKTCCNGKHLRLGSPIENMADAKQENRLGRRLKNADVLEIVALFHRDDASMGALAHRFKVSRQTIRNIVFGKTHAKLTGIKFIPRKPGRPIKPIEPMLPFGKLPTHSGVELVM